MSDAIYTLQENRLQTQNRWRENRGRKCLIWYRAYLVIAYVGDLPM